MSENEIIRCRGKVKRNFRNKPRDSRKIERRDKKVVKSTYSTTQQYVLRRGLACHCRNPWTKNHSSIPAQQNRDRCSVRKLSRIQTRL